MARCPFCDISDSEQVLIEGDLLFFMSTADPVLVESGMILPRAHRETVFDLTEDEWAESFTFLAEVKKYLDEKYSPDGYNVGWNVGSSGGMSIPHSHMHVIPRFDDEPLAGKGIRNQLKQPENRRRSAGDFSQ
ncbi:MAG: HIT domain-containing protein [Chloroflexi bacterium]|jgi:diadenosine tetraphosphate (Ap4A) HIT family hydrolase|nr:HIT domain-containing protein [Chloroflexota bacterium]MBT5627046.1 HIT domain-containing protein [Chloroflexota bacterium]